MLGRHMTFEPRVELARRLARDYCITAMIDLSDGLSRDLHHICRESGVGAVISRERIPIHPDAVEMSRDGGSPVEHALHDGEDYELLFTSPSIVPDTIARSIGVILPASQGVTLGFDNASVPLIPQGWEHPL
jgi:thiamine-monophosphate kinase